tara:strand:+ start:7402 stop:7806 length:405 start_codon:yes stop_codon:yes gene_type:complete
MDRPDIENIKKTCEAYGEGHGIWVIQNLCEYILLLEAHGGWTHQGASRWFQDTCGLIGWDPPPYSWFARVCRSYGYQTPIGVLRRFANQGKTVMDLNGSPLPYFGAIMENIHIEQQNTPEGKKPPYRKEYEVSK